MNAPMMSPRGLKNVRRHFTVHPGEKRSLRKRLRAATRRNMRAMVADFDADDPRHVLEKWDDWAEW